MFCQHRNHSWPFTTRVPNPNAGMPMYRNDMLVMRNGRVVYEPATLPESYIVCLDCGAKADYDVNAFIRTSKWYKDAYEHKSSGLRALEKMQSEEIFA